MTTAEHAQTAVNFLQTVKKALASVPARNFRQGHLYIKKRPHLCCALGHVIALIDFSGDYKAAADANAKESINFIGTASHLDKITCMQGLKPISRVNDLAPKNAIKETVITYLDELIAFFKERAEKGY